ncbi:putative transcription factor B3-Domain family [Helianthus anomalus]
MDSRKSAHSFIAFIDKEEPVLMIIRDGENLRKVRIRKTNDGPVFTDGWILLVRHHQLKYKDGNSYITAQVETELGMSVYFGERFWNVRLEGSSEGGYFKAGWRKVVEEVPLDKDYFLVFTRLESKTFDVSVFDPDTGTKEFLKKVESIADDDMIVESKLPTDVCEYDIEGNQKDPIPSDFATNLWGDKVPYGKTVQIRDGDSLRFVRIKREIKRFEIKRWSFDNNHWAYTFNVSCFKEHVCQNSYFTAQLNAVPKMTLMPDKFWNNFYGKNYKGEMARCCCFKDGWLKLVEEVPLENELYLVFTMIDLKTLELSVFDPETGTEMVFKKDDVLST